MPMFILKSTFALPIIVSCAVFAFTAHVNAETIRFPKDDPALTLEVPDGATMEFKEDDSLTVKFKGKISYAYLNKIDQCPTDKDAAERAQKEAWDKYWGVDYLGRSHLFEKKKLTDGIWMLEAAVSGQASRETNSGVDIFGQGVVLWVNEKRCFLLSFAYDMNGMKDYLAFIKTLKPIQ